MRKNSMALLVFASMIVASVISQAYTVQPNCLEGVWNNFDFSRPPEDWALAAHESGGKDSVVDLVVAQANTNGLVYLPFPFQSTEHLYSCSQTDKIEPYLERFDVEDLSVILSIQPLGADVTQIIDMLLSRYGNHGGIIGVNVDLEWKESGTANHVSDEERDIWLNVMRSYNSKFKLFLTCFADYTHFPNDAADLTILYDGEDDIQRNLLAQYREIADHYNSVGIYTGYSTSTPPTASYERIVSSVPNTQYIIHTDDVFSNKTTLIFEMDDVQVDWLESATVRLVDLHLQRRVPTILGVIPNNFNNPNVGGGYLANNLKDLDKNYFDVFEIGQHGYTHHESEELRGKGYEEQKGIIENGLEILSSIGVESKTFVPPFGSADETTVKVAEDLNFTVFVDLYQNLRSDKLVMIDSWVSLTDRVENTTVLKSPEQVMAEIDEKTEEKAVVVLYQIFDVQDSSQRTKFSNILDALKESKKYNFMTARQYAETLEATTPTSQNQSQPTGLPDWSLYAIAAVLSTVTIVILVRKRAIAHNKRQTSTGSTDLV